MKNHSDVFSMFQGFLTKIQNQFDTSIKILRTNNAREYISSQFQSFMSSQGIRHQTSCSHTTTEWSPQKKELALG